MTQGSAHDSSTIVAVAQSAAEERPGRLHRLRLIDDRLAIVYGRPRWHSHGSPLDELIATVLSQNTSDINSARAFSSLRSRFPSWEDVVSAHTADVADAIRSGGLADLKASRIQDILRAVAVETGQMSLDWLGSRSLGEARAWLTALTGVGPKTAACVLLFSLGLPVMPVDTHVLRVSRRLGLIPNDLNVERAHAALDQLIGSDRDATYVLHLNLIEHGRSTCTARHPACRRCNLSDFCPSADLGLSNRLV